MKEHQYTRLDNSEDGLSDLEHTAVNVEQRSHALRRRRVYPAMIFLLILSNLVFIVLWVQSRQLDKVTDCVRPLLTYSPAREAIAYERKRLYRDITPKNDFAGRPRPELDAAWKKLIEPITIKVSAEEVEHADLGEPTIAFQDGSGYIAEVAVYHELHCVKRIRRAFHMDYYYPNISDSERAREDAHVDHCLEYLREAAMCHADVNLASFYWRKDGPTSHVWSDHECVNWNRLDSWMRARMVSASDLTRLEKPVGELPDVPQFTPGEH